MKKYIHPKLLREANKNDCWVVSLISWPLIGERVSISEILALWFEPVKEETPEWIEKAYDYRVLAWFKDRYTFNKVILDNMPKQEQQKITIDEIDRWAYAQLNYSEKELGIRAIVNFLISQWLLQE